MFAGVSIQLDFTYTLPFSMMDMFDVKPISNLYYNQNKFEIFGNAYFKFCPIFKIGISNSQSKSNSITSFSVCFRNETEYITDSVQFFFVLFNCYLCILSETNYSVLLHILAYGCHTT